MAKRKKPKSLSDLIHATHTPIYHAQAMCRMLQEYAESRIDQSEFAYDMMVGVGQIHELIDDLQKLTDAIESAEVRERNPDPPDRAKPFKKFMGQVLPGERL